MQYRYYPHYVGGSIFLLFLISSKKLKKFNKEVVIMKQSIFKSYDELPLFLNAEMVAKVLGVATSTAYELMHEKDFPALKIGSRLIVPKEKFRQWVDSKTNL